MANILASQFMMITGILSYFIISWTLSSQYCPFCLLSLSLYCIHTYIYIYIYIYIYTYTYIQCIYNEEIRLTISL